MYVFGKQKYKVILNCFVLHKFVILCKACFSIFWIKKCCLAEWCHYLVSVLSLRWLPTASHQSVICTGLFQCYHVTLKENYYKYYICALFVLHLYPPVVFFCFFLVTLELSTCMPSPWLRILPGSTQQDRIVCTDP